MLELLFSAALFCQVFVIADVLHVGKGEHEGGLALVPLRLGLGARGLACCARAPLLGRWSGRGWSGGHLLLLLLL